jgi:hypothetical protein
MLRWTIVALFSLTITLPAGTPRDPWKTPAGRAATAEIQNLRELGIFDDLREYHDELTEALREGCTKFIPWPSRIACPGMRKPTPERCAVSVTVRVLYRVMPIAADELSPVGYVRWSERGRNRAELR